MPIRAFDTQHRNLLVCAHAAPFALSCKYAKQGFGRHYTSQRGVNPTSHDKKAHGLPMTRPGAGAMAVHGWRAHIYMMKGRSSRRTGETGSGQRSVAKTFASHTQHERTPARTCVPSRRCCEAAGNRAAAPLWLTEVHRSRETSRENMCCTHAHARSSDGTTGRPGMDIRPLSRSCMQIDCPSRWHQQNYMRTTRVAERTRRCAAQLCCIISAARMASCVCE
jgi:hypothetical protein